MTLAIYGGEPVRKRPFPPRPPYGIEERNVANEVVASGQLSGFLAESGDAFLGGPRVRSLERAICERFGVKHAVAMNSGTSGLFGAVAALNPAPRDEFIVSPWSMSASVACVRSIAVPVFADIEPETFCLDPESVESVITERTKAIVYVDLFGCAGHRFDELRGIADEHGIPIIEDAAQAMGAIFWYPSEDPLGGTAFAGTLGEIGVYSFNRHKTLQCGEGGVVVTDHDEIADFLRGYRNHGEVINYRQGYVGGNYRLGEVEAAIAEVQLSRLDKLTLPRCRNTEKISAALYESEISQALIPPYLPANQRHACYLYALRVRDGLQAARIAHAIRAEGISISFYVEPLYEIPAYRGYALRDDSRRMKEWYYEARRAYRQVLVMPHVHAGMKDEDIDDVIAAIKKVWHHREEL